MSGGLLLMIICYTAKELAQSVQKYDSFSLQIQKQTTQLPALVWILFEYLFQKFHTFQF